MNDLGPAEPASGGPRDGARPPPADGPLRRSADLGADLTSATKARELVRQWCLGWGFPEAAEPAEMVVTELVENAVCHACSEAELTATLQSDTLTIAVRDLSGDLPLVRHPTVDQRGGRGMHLIEMVAQDWGVEPAGAGKLVWAAIALE